MNKCKTSLVSQKAAAEKVLSLAVAKFTGGIVVSAEAARLSSLSLSERTVQSLSRDISIEGYVNILVATGILNRRIARLTRKLCESITEQIAEEETLNLEELEGVTTVNRCVRVQPSHEFMPKRGERRTVGITEFSSKSLSSHKKPAVIAETVGTPLSLNLPGESTAFESLDAVNREVLEFANAAEAKGNSRWLVELNTIAIKVLKTNWVPLLPCITPVVEHIWTGTTRPPGANRATRCRH